MVSLVRQWRTRRWLSRLWRGRKQGWVNTWQHQNSSRVDETHNTTIKRSIKSISSTYDDFSYKRDSYKILKKTQRNVDMLGRKAEKIQAMHNREICNKGEYWKEEIQEKKEKKWDISSSRHNASSTRPANRPNHDHHHHHRRRRCCQ